MFILTALITVSNFSTRPAVLGGWGQSIAIDPDTRLVIYFIKLKRMKGKIDLGRI